MALIKSINPCKKANNYLCSRLTIHLLFLLYHAVTHERVCMGFFFGVVYNTIEPFLLHHLQMS